MKRLLMIVFCLFALLFATGIHASAQYDSEDILKDTEKDLFSIFDNSTIEALDEFGINHIDYSEVYNISFKSFLTYFSTNTKEKSKEAINFFFMLTAVLLLSGVLKTLAGFENDETFELICIMVTVLITVSKMNVIINSAMSVLNAGSKFLISYVPIFASLVAISGNPASAATYNTLVLAFSQGISLFLNKFAQTIIGGFYCISIAFSINKNTNLSRFTGAFSKICSVSIGLIASLFASLLSIKGVLSANIDSVGAKGIRFIISSVIPVIGGAISDAYSSIVGSLNVIKGSVALIGIIACLIIGIPSILETLLYFASLNILSFFAESMGCIKISQLFKALSTGLRFIMLLLVFEIFITIISTGLMMSLKSAL